MKIGNLPKKIFLPLIYLPMKIFPRNFAHLFTYEQLFEFHQIINTLLHIIKKTYHHTRCLSKFCSGTAAAYNTYLQLR